jgi:LuxR family maltose regulon positive regulatory protein
VPRDEVVEAMIQQVLDELPASMRVMVSSSVLPRLDLSRLSGAGRLVLLERADLVLGRDESEEYLRQVAPDLPAGRLRPLAELANGWIAALRASTSAIGSDPSADPAAWLLGPGLEVLFGRGLQVLDATDRDLLVLCSVLDQMSPEVCDAVTGRLDGAERLAALSERLLVARVPGPGPARYETHPLLREYLGRKLAERGRGAAARAHEAAGVWLAENGDAEAAISHLLDCGRIELAREVLSAHVRDLLDAGRSEHVRTWYRRAPELAVPDHELLLLAGAWSELLAGDVTAAGVHLVELEAATGTMRRSAREDDAATAAEWLRVQVLFLRSYLEAWTGQTARAAEHLRTVRAAFGADWSRMAHQAAAFHEARLALWHGDPQSMRRMLMQLSGRAGTLQFYRQVAIPSLGALVAAEEGRAQRACFLADSALDALTESGRLGAVDACDARLARARALGDLGQTVAAASEAAVVQDTAAQVEHVPYLVLGAVHRARALAAGGHRAGAEQQLEAARAIVTQRSVRGPLRQALDRASAEVAIISGDRAGARRALEGLDEGRSRDVLAIRALSLGGQLTEAEAVRMIQTARPQSPREVVDARLAMVTFTAATRRPEAVMHLQAAAAVANEHGMILALQGRSEEVLVLAAQLASQGADPAVAALVGALPRPAEPVRRAPAPLSAGEHQLLERLALFPGNRELAEDLGITANTLKTRLRRLYAKLGVHDRDAALQAARPGS